MLKYKGFEGEFEIDTNTGILFGRVLNTSDVITFRSETAEGAAQSFRDSIEDYLEFCQERGDQPKICCNEGDDFCDRTLC